MSSSSSCRIVAGIYSALIASYSMFHRSTRFTAGWETIVTHKVVVKCWTNRI